MIPFPLWLRYPLFALALWALAADPTSGDVIILKDGTALHGFVGKEQSLISDPFSGETFTAGKLNGLKFVDDGPRWTIFSDHRTRLGDVQNQFNKFADLEQVRRLPVYGPRDKLPQSIRFVSSGDFDAKWTRMLRYDDVLGRGRFEIRQAIVLLNPYYVRLDSLNYVWTSYYHTRELGPDLVRKLLNEHPDLAEKEGQYDANKRARKIRFFIQAEWYDEAEKDLTDLLRLIPSEKERVEKMRKEIVELKAEKTLADIEWAHETGRNKWARSELKKLPKDLPGKMTIKIAGIEAELANLEKQYAIAKRLLTRTLEQKVSNGTLMSAGVAVLNELKEDNAPRLEAFVSLAAQAEEAAKAGKKVLHKPEELLALAVTGWLLGKNSAETKIDSAVKMWQAREVALRYQRTIGLGARNAILADYLKSSQQIGVDELAQLISLLPPADADINPPTTPAKRESGPLPGLKEGVDYLLQLPPEYHHGRPYPLLIALPNGNEKLEECLRRFEDYPNRTGFIVAVLKWNGGFRNDYGYTAEEHLTVTGLLWHLRRRYQVDSDRVFLCGYGEGATMAMDIGSGHPDLFAGIVPIGPRPSWNLLRDYWRNFQQTPLYLVSGDIVGDSIKPIRNCLEQWMPKGYPVLTVLYKGRGFEWFGGEMPHIFDWMPRQKRSQGVPQVGRDFGAVNADDYRTLRKSDNSFYWIGIDHIAANFLYENNRNGTGAAIFGKIGEGNAITLRTRGIEQATLWFGKGMIDFEKPVKVQWNGSDVRVNGNKPLTANYAVLLEDLYERGDRQRPFFEKLELSTSRKK